ncbi:hypothetical protein VTN31DRAFT_2389 [Thermomyces dupontii]|uniref:uncharacterized protein n=1 Tax=Talaromyces thermophilus TaxID=28565 RepID=UPI0037444201
MTRFLSLTDDDGSSNARMIHTLLRALKSELAPTSLDHKRQVATEYARLQHPPQGRNLIAWIDRWRLIKPELEAAGLSEALTFVPDFLKANMQVDPNFTSARSTDALRGKISWKELVEDFRLHYRYLGTMESNSAFKATLGGKGPTTDPPKKSNEGPAKKSSRRPEKKQERRQSKRRVCLCGD